jgi:hypothetical protein
MKEEILKNKFKIYNKKEIRILQKEQIDFKVRVRL